MCMNSSIKGIQKFHFDMFNSSSRVHEQIVDLLTKAHTSHDNVAQRVHLLQQAMEVLLYHTTGNDRIDEFLETFLSMHVDKQIPVRRFVAHFIEILCFTRSRYACSCLEVLVTLLQDADKQVVIFALRAARVVYKRALYFISVQQKDTRYTTPARESLQTLDHVLAQIVHHITSGNREVFCEAIRCAQTVVLCQSYSSLNPKSQSQLEIAGCSCLEDLRLVDSPSSVLEESKLKSQSDKLFSALCALLVKHRAEPMEIVALIHAVGVVGHDRSSYAGAATIAFSQLAANDQLISGTRVRSALTMELKRILSSRYCVQWQPRIIPILNSLGISTSETSTNLVMEAELDRLKEQVMAQMGTSISDSKTDEDISLEKEGERLLAISEIADCFKVPDEDHAVAICSVRAKNPAELAKLALAMLNRLPKKYDDPGMALVKVNRSGASVSGSGGNSIGFENRVKAIKSMGITFKRYLDGVVEQENLTSDEETEMDHEPPQTMVQETVGETEHHLPVFSSDSVPSGDLMSSIALKDKRMFSRLMAKVSSDAHVLGNLFASELHSGSVAGISELLTVLYVNQLTGGHEVATTLDTAGEVFVSVVKEMGGIDFNLVRTLIMGSENGTIPGIPFVPNSILDLVDTTVETGEPSMRRAALTILASLALTKPGMSMEALNRIFSHATSSREDVRTDSLKLILAKLYRPSAVAILKWQWPYKDTSGCQMKRVGGMGDFLNSRLEVVCSQYIEDAARERFESGIRDNLWNQMWPMLALSSKKPVLIHYIVHHIVEDATEGVAIPTEIVQSFAASLAALQGDVVDRELELVVKEYKSIRAATKKKRRNEVLLPILSAISNTSRGLNDKLADAALSLNK